MRLPEKLVEPSNLSECSEDAFPVVIEDEKQGEDDHPDHHRQKDRHNHQVEHMLGV
jgi:hypothetical protein